MGATTNIEPGLPESPFASLDVSARSSGLAEAIAACLLIASDISVILVSYGLAQLLRNGLLARMPFFSERGESIGLEAYFAFIPVYIMVFGISGLYTNRSSSIEDGVRTVRACFYATACVLIFASMAQVSHYFSRLVIAMAFCFAAVAVPAIRYFLKLRMGSWQSWQRPVVLLNVNAGGLRAAEDLAADPTTGYRIAGVFTDRELETSLPWPVWRVTSIEDGIDWCRRKGVRSFLLCDHPSDTGSLQRRVRLLDEFAIEVKIAAVENGLHMWRVESEVLKSSFLLKHENPLANPLNRLLKRALDICAGLGIVLLFLPALVLIPLWIRLREGSPVLYAHRRQGQLGVDFRCWKFRTMRRDADDQLRRMLESDPQVAAEFHSSYKLRSDPRVTASGRWLRRSSLDELPQLWNVLAGDMSLVGPRPRLTEEAVFRDLQAPFGLTGLWQISGRSDLSYEERNRLDLFYVRNWSIWLDIVILARTAAYLLRPRGAY